MIYRNHELTGECNFENNKINIFVSNQLVDFFDEHECVNLNNSCQLKSFESSSTTAFADITVYDSDDDADQHEKMNIDEKVNNSVVVID